MNKCRECFRWEACIMPSELKENCVMFKSVFTVIREAVEAIKADKIPEPYEPCRFPKIMKLPIVNLAENDEQKEEKEAMLERLRKIRLERFRNDCRTVGDVMLCLASIEGRRECK